jgi:hypothetical protein
MERLKYTLEQRFILYNRYVEKKSYKSRKCRFHHKYPSARNVYNAWHINSNARVLFLADDGDISNTQADDKNQTIWSVSQVSVLSHLPSIGACALRNISYQQPLSIIYDILSLTNSFFVTANTIPYA